MEVQIPTAVQILRMKYPGELFSGDPDKIKTGPTRNDITRSYPWK